MKSAQMKWESKIKTDLVFTKIYCKFVIYFFYQLQWLSNSIKDNRYNFLNYSGDIDIVDSKFLLCL